MNRFSIFFLAAILLSAAACAPAATPTNERPLPAAPPSPSVGAPTAVPTPTVKPTATPRPVQLPAPPAPLRARSGSTEEQAIALANAVDQGSTNRLAGWLGVYDALGIPVLRQDGSPIGTTGDDPIGPPFWRVWYMTGMSTSRSGIRLSDVGKLLLAGGTPSVTPALMSETLLADLRAAMNASQPQVKLFGRFSQELFRRGPGAPDLSDPKVTADQITISGDYAELVTWVVARGLLFDLAKRDTARAGEHDLASRYDSVHPIAFLSAAAINPLFQSGWGETGWARPASKESCAESLGNEQVTYWVNWIMNKVSGGGVQLPGMQQATKGLVEVMQERRGTAQRVIDRTKTVTGIVNAGLTALSFAMQLAALTVDSNMEPMPLVRTKGSTYDGNEARVYFRLTSDVSNLPDGDNLAACLSSFMLNLFGVSFNLPTQGRIAGAELTFEGGMGFGKYVLFGDYKTARHADTNLNGEVEVLVTGKAQRRTIPDKAKAIGREFSIHVYAQPEAANGTALFNTFLDSLQFATSPSVSGAVTPIIDIAKTFHYYKGEFVFPIKDWETGYRVDQAYGPGRLTGTICGLEQPFKLQFTGSDFGGVFTYTPVGSNGGAWTYNGTVGGGLATNTGAGAFKVEGEEDTVPVIQMDAGYIDVSTSVGGGRGNGLAVTIQLEPLDGQCQ